MTLLLGTHSLPIISAHRSIRAFLLLTITFVFQTTVVDETSIAEGPLDFTRDVRPILSNACFTCHGPDVDKREAGLRLDTLDGLTGDHGGSIAVVPGEVAKSELAKRILSDDPDEQMPPPASNKSLSDKQKRILLQWIEQGATWKQHWAFVVPQLPSIPEVKNQAWCLNEIDRFVLQRLDRFGLTPSAEAPPHLLVRRLFLDLIGLPPTPEEAQKWIDKIWPNREAVLNEAAYQELISYLLDSPHYGERWGRRWLDLARYADSNGYEKDRDRSIWPYRDWVVDAFNQDMPFDQFTIEQIAGDMLPDATESQRIATGFHRNTMLNEEGGIDPLEFRFHAMTDRVATTGTTWLGLTLGCCQCHTHKYDPVTHTEYYQLMALLNNADEPSLELPSKFSEGDFNKKWQANQRQAAKLMRDLPEHWPVATNSKVTPTPSSNNASASKTQVDETSIQAAYDKWLAAERANVVRWSHLQPVSATSNLPILTIEADDTIFASGDTAKRDEYVITLAAHASPITALRLEALPDERLPARGPGSTYYEGTLGDFYLVELAAKSQTGKVHIASASDSFAKNQYGNNPAAAQLTIDGDVQTGWSVAGRQGERHVAVYQLHEPLPVGAELTITLTFGRHFASSLGRFRFSATDAAHPTQARATSDEVESLLLSDSNQLNAEQNQQLFEQFLMSAPELAKHTEPIRKLLARPELPATLVLAERPAQHPRPTYRHHRGEYLQPAEQVEPGVPAVLPPLSRAEPANRLALARWLVSPDNPLTARVMVNRQWAALFGTGIVSTLDDFGLQGEAPSHPELLDWLAVNFIREDDWSLKRLHRRLVSSRTYRQTSQVNPAATQIDPNNRLLSYSPRFRLDAEVLRDSLLVASGQLSRQLGGPPVRPPQAKGISEVAFGSPKWEASTGADRYRRSLYTFVKRTAPFAMTSTFDAPSGEACIAKRSRSNSPLQALTLLNDEMLIDMARAAGQRYAAVGLVDRQQLSQQLGQLFQSVLVRLPSEDELQLLSQFWHAQQTAFEQHPELARQLVASETKHPAHTAAWIATARALFALDETQTR